jgi:hypothetical protein
VKLRSHIRAAAQAVWEIFHPEIWVRWRPFSIRIDNEAPQRRIEAARRGAPIGRQL